MGFRPALRRAFAGFVDDEAEAIDGLVDFIAREGSSPFIGTINNKADGGYKNLPAPFFFPFWRFDGR